MSKDPLERWLPLGMRFLLKNLCVNGPLTIWYVCFTHSHKDEFRREMVPDEYYL